MDDLPVKVDLQKFIQTMVMEMETRHIVEFITDLVSDKSFFTSDFADTVIARIKEDHLS